MSDLSNEPILTRIVLSHQEYSRLKNIEEKYYKLQQDYEQLKNSRNQTGGGFQLNVAEDDEEDSIIKIANLVANRLNKQAETTIHSDSIVPQTVPSLASINELPSSSFGVQITKSDDNTEFEELRLLSLIPKRNQKNAKLLLDEFNNRGNELTWNSNGNIFVKTVAIPNSNIFELFPYLFQSKFKKMPHLIGFEELLSQINEMGLQNLISFKLSTNQTNQKKSSTTSNIKDKTGGSHNVESTIPWYYIGP